MNTDLSTFSPSRRISSRELIHGLHLNPGNRILVVGAGVFGGWTALNLLRLGYRVTLADAWGPGNSRSSSGGESRLIRAIYGDNKKYFDMTMDAWKGWEELEGLSGIDILHKTGVAWYFHTEGQILREAISRIMDERNLTYELVSGEGISKHFPGINPEGLESILIEQKAGYLDARKACQLVRNQFEKEGGSFELAWVSPGKNRDLLSGLQIGGVKKSFETYVFACGPWLPELFPDLLSKKLHVSRQEVHYFGIPKNYEQQYSSLLPFIDWDPGYFFYGIPGNNSRGFKVACDIRGEAVDPTNMDRSPNQSEIARSKEYIAKRFPGMRDAPLLESRVCQYTNSPDGNFLIDFHPDYENIWLIGGGSGHGFKHGPAIGKLASKIISGQIPLDPDFTLPD